MEEEIRMHLRNGSGEMSLASIQNISEISIQRSFVQYGALSALVESQEHDLSYSGLKLRSGYVRSLIFPGVPEKKL
jgi:hypothetical protein